MQYKSNKGFTGMGQLGIIFLLLGVGLMVTGVIQVIIAYKMVPADTSFSALSDAMLASMNKPENLNWLRLLQVLSTLFMFFIPAVIYSWICNGKNIFWLGFNKYVNVYQILIGFLIIFTANVSAGPLQDLTEKIVAYFPSMDALAKTLETKYNDQVIAISHINGVADLLLVLVIMAFLPAMFEEVFFRAVLQNLFVKWWKMPLLAIIFTSIIFSFIHMSVYLFLSRAILGFALGLMFHYTKNIWVNIIAHFLNNAIALIEMFILNAQKKKVDVSNLDVKVDWWIGIVAIASLYGLFIFLKKYSENNKLKIFYKEQTLLVNEPSGNPLA